MKNSLRYKLLGWFLLFAFLIILVIVPVNLLHQKRQQELGLIKDSFQQLHTTVLRDLEVSNHFLNTVAHDTHFFLTGENQYLQKQQLHAHKADSLLQQIQAEKSITESGMSEDIFLLEQSLYAYNRVFDSIVQLTYRKGNASFGLEGQLREYLQLSNNASPVATTDLTQLRLAAFDYLLDRNQQQADNHHAIYQQILGKYTRPAVQTNTDAIHYLQNYQSAFEKLLAYDQAIGAGNFAGLENSLLTHANHINNRLHSISQQSTQVYQSVLSNVNGFYFLLTGLLIFLSFFISFIVSKRLSQPLQALTSYIQELANNHFHYPADNNLQHSNKEISLIYKAFRNLVTQLYIRENQRDAARKKSEENERKYRELAEMLPQCIFETDHLGNYTFVNKEWYRTFGYTVKDLNEGLNLIETLISQQGERIMDDIPLENSDFIALRKDRSQFPAAIYTSSIVKEGKATGKRGIIIDVTERNKFIHELKKERNKALTSDQLKSYFLANMSHEIRTPMNSIIGFSELLNTPELSESQKNDFIDHIKSSGELLLNLIDDIIDIAKIEAGEIKIVQRDCNLHDLFNELKEVFTDYKRREHKDHLDIELTLPPEEHIVKSDPFRLKQILHNLISNAIKFTHEGKVEFGYRIINGNQILFTVKDTGIGLSRDKLNFIFERFKQLEMSGKNYKGAGLGLAITKNLVELLGGELHVNSTSGKGTDFSFTHPFVLLREVKPDIQEQKVPEQVYDWSDYTFLIAEDNDQNYIFLQEALKTTGVSIIRATDGEQAVRLALKNPVDLILMDVRLPIMDGYEATKNIKHKKPKLPVIAQTAHAMADEKEKSIMAGCDDYMAKPIRINSLFPKIAQFMPAGHPIPAKPNTSLSKTSSRKST